MRKGFTLVEVIVVLVTLAVLAAIMIPAMTGWIDKAKEKRLLVACRTCVIAAQTLASEAYGENGTVTPPDGAAVTQLAGVPGTASNISLDGGSAAVNILTYSDGTEEMTYIRQAEPQYSAGAGIAKEMAAAANWAQKNMIIGTAPTNAQLTMKYGNENPRLYHRSNARQSSEI